MSILVVAEQRGGVLNRMSWETVSAAQQIGKELSGLTFSGRNAKRGN